MTMRAASAAVLLAAVAGSVALAGCDECHPWFGEPFGCVEYSGTSGEAQIRGAWNESRLADALAPFGPVTHGTTGQSLRVHNGTMGIELTAPFTAGPRNDTFGGWLDVGFAAPPSPGWIPRGQAQAQAHALWEAHAADYRRVVAAVQAAGMTVEPDVRVDCACTQA